MRRRGKTRSSSRPPPALHYLSLVCSLGLSPRLPFAHSPRASTHLSSLQPCGASRLRTSRTASPRPGSTPPAASGSPPGHVPCLCLIPPENRVHAAGGRITRRCSRLARACSSALRAGSKRPIESVRAGRGLTAGVQPAVEAKVAAQPVGVRSSMRAAGCVATRSRTSLKYRKGSTPASLHPWASV